MNAGLLGKYLGAVMLRNALLATSSNGINQDRFGKERERPLFEGKQNPDCGYL